MILCMAQLGWETEAGEKMVSSGDYLTFHYGHQIQPVLASQAVVSGVYETPTFREDTELLHILPSGGRCPILEL